MTDSKDEPEIPELDALVARAMVKRGDLLPTTTEEVQGAGDIEFEGDLPEALRSFAPPAPRTRGPSPSAEARAVDVPRRQGARVIELAAVFSLGAIAAAAATFMIYARRPEPLRAPVAEVGSAAPGPGGATTGTAAPAREVKTIGPVLGCDDCCAGASCSSAKPELASCPTGRACVACNEAIPPDAAYRLRLGNFHPTKSVDARSVEALDVCVRVGGSPWSCEPAYLDATARPLGRVLPTLSRAEDLTSSVELELRLRGADRAYGAWRSGLRLGPTMFCRGVGVVLESPDGEHMGGLSLFVEDAFFVEIARAEAVPQLAERRRGLAFADVVPAVVPSKSGGFVLVVGPLAKPAADKLRSALLEAGEEAGVSTGGDFAGPPERLP